MEVLQDLDRSLFLVLNSFHTAFLNQVMTFLSGQLIWLPFVSFFLIHCYKIKGRSGTTIFLLFLLLSLAASDVTSSYIFKNTFTRLRPCHELELKLLINNFGQKCGGRYGFVSSHAANSVAMVLFSLRTLNFKKIIYFVWLIPIFVSFSRIYLGVHYPGDILGGAIVGAMWSLIFSQMYKSVQGARRKTSHPDDDL